MSIDVAAVDRALDEVRPHLHGGVEVVAVDGATVRLRFTGKCADCELQQVTLRQGVEVVLKARVPGIVAVTSDYAGGTAPA